MVSSWEKWNKILNASMQSTSRNNFTPEAKFAAVMCSHEKLNPHAGLTPLLSGGHFERKKFSPQGPFSIFLGLDVPQLLFLRLYCQKLDI